MLVIAFEIFSSIHQLYKKVGFIGIRILCHDLLSFFSHTKEHCLISASFVTCMIRPVSLPSAYSFLSTILASCFGLMVLIIRGYRNIQIFFLPCSFYGKSSNLAISCKTMKFSCIFAIQNLSHKIHYNKLGKQTIDSEI